MGTRLVTRHARASLTFRLPGRVTRLSMGHKGPAGEGVGPSYWASKAHVLPLDDPAIYVHL